MTDLFTKLKPFLKGAELTFTLKAKGDQLTVSVMPKGELIDDDDNHIVPLLLTGTAEELDKDFVATIIKPIEKAVGIVTNLEEFQEAVDKTAEENKSSTKTPADKKPDVKKEAAPKMDTKKAAPKMDTKKADADKKRQEAEEKKKAEADKRDRKTKLDALNKKADSLEKGSLFRDAIGCLIEAKAFAENPEGIDTRIESIIKKADPMGFFTQDQIDELKATKTDFISQLFKPKAEVKSEQEKIAPPPTENLVEENPTPESPAVDPNATEPNDELVAEAVVDNTGKGEEL